MELIILWSWVGREGVNIGRVKGYDCIRIMTFINREIPRNLVAITSAYCQF